MEDKLKKEIALIKERASYRELHNSGVAERIIRALIRSKGKAEARRVKVKDLD